MSHPLETKIPPPLVTLAIAAAMGVASRYAPETPLPETVRYGVAASLFLAAGALGATAIGAFARARTTIDPVHVDTASSLVVGGAFRISRNPMYLAMTLLLTAFAVALSSLWLLAGPMAFILFTTSFQIVPEERAMRAQFGDAYVAYCRKVRRWL
jgi:protein-S-isoprenylcysteine O-methyltransferase Ste14